MSGRNRVSAGVVDFIVYGVAAAAIFSGVTTLNGPHSDAAGTLAVGAIVVGVSMAIGWFFGGRPRQ